MTTAGRWAHMPLTFDRMREKRDRKKELRFRINHRTQQAIALQENARTDAEREVARAFWREVDELKRELKEVGA